MKVFYITLISLLTLLGCNKTEDTGKSSKKADLPVANAYFINSILYNYFSAEYKALCFQAFNAASDHLELFKIKNPKLSNLAIVLDIDETLLDNSPYQAKIYEINVSYDSLWNDWCNLEMARPIPGSAEFLHKADSMGFNIFYISNRKSKFVYDSTLKNLQFAEFPQADSSHLLLRTEGNNKESRRNKVAEKYEIVLLVGDNIGDFYEDTSDYAIRDSQVKLHKADFGRKLIVLPNSIYGNWIESLGIRSQEEIDSLVAIMTKPFDNLKDQ